MIEKFRLKDFIQQQRFDKHISMPMEFEWPTGDLLCKQLTKLNNQHQYRIHYMGPRFRHTLALHKKYSSSQDSPNLNHPLLKDIPKYKINTRNIIQSYFMTDRLRKNAHYKSTLYYRAFEGMNPTLTLESQFVFNSAFQSGNLDFAIKVKPNQFDLFLRIDSNTRGHMNWFYFSVKNGKRRQKLKLNICNLKKRGTLYQKGMQPYVFSNKKFQIKHAQWEQGGTNLRMTKKDLRYKFLYNRITIPNLFTMTVEYQFEFEDDEVFFAYCIPYTYSQMLHHISSLSHEFTQIHTLGHSMSGLVIPVVHITNFDNCKGKKNVLITGRVHPCESNSSHTLKGFIDFLCSSSKEAQELRNRVNFIIVPMINPDGVVVGNSRTGLAGKDLNREFDNPSKEVYPEVFMIKGLVQNLQGEVGICTYLDFHGHSCKKNTFFYGPPYVISQPQYYKCRILPRLVEKITNSFRFYGCSYSIPEGKKKTARAVMFDHYKIPYPYTVESSIGFYYDSQKMVTYSFNTKSWNHMGESICLAFSKFFVALQEYQEFLRQKRLLRDMKKQRERQKQRKIQQRQKERQKKRTDLKSDQNHSAPIHKQACDLQKETIQKVSFVQMIEEIKIIAALKSKLKEDDQDRSMSSDDHNQEEDFQPTTFQEFNTLLIHTLHAANSSVQKNSETIQDVLANQRKRSLDKPHLNLYLSTLKQDNEEQINLFKKLGNKSMSGHSNRSIDVNNQYTKHLENVEGRISIRLHKQQSPQRVFRPHRKVLKAYKTEKQRKQSSQLQLDKFSMEPSIQNTQQTSFKQDRRILGRGINNLRIKKFPNQSRQRSPNFYHTIDTEMICQQPAQLNLTFSEYSQQKKKFNVYRKIKVQSPCRLKQQSDFIESDVKEIQQTLHINNSLMKDPSTIGPAKHGETVPFRSSFYGVRQNMLIKSNRNNSSAHRKIKYLSECHGGSFNLTIKCFQK